MTLCFGIMWASVSSAELYLIVHQSSGVDTISKEQVRDLYMGRYIAQNQSQEQMKPLDQEDEALRQYFYSAVSGKSLRQINSYWARLIFSGRGRPPPKISYKEVINSVANSTDVIGYISSLDAIKDKPVSVVHTIREHAAD